MLLALIASVFAAEPPTFAAPVVTGAKSKKDAALVVANEDYTTLADATGAAADADAFAALLVSTRGVPADRVARLKDANLDQLRLAASVAGRTVKRGGTLWVYWSGHGALREDGQRVLLGADVPAEGTAAAGLPLADVLRALEAGKAERIVVVVDAGFGGVGRAGERLFPADAKQAPTAVSASPRATVWLATTGVEPAHTWPATQRGMFSAFAIGALRGWADGQLGTPADNVVTLQEAQGYVAKVVRQLGGGEQKTGREPRADVAGWPVMAGALEGGPSKEDLAAWALAEKARRVKKAEGELRKVATADWAQVAAKTETASPEAIGALKAFLLKYDAATVQVDGAAVAVAIPEVADARGRLDKFSRVEKKGKKKKPKTPKGKAAPPPVVAGPTDACQDLLKLEPKAMTGEITAEEMACLETRLAAEKVQTTKDKLSRVLLVAADAKGDSTEWMRLMARHLEEVDRSDPDLCFKYALALSRGEIEDAEAVLKWSAYALENKHLWEGPMYMSRVYNLLRLRAETATRLWHEAEDDFLEERTDENMELAEEHRGQAKTLAREWLDYARISGQPVERAETLCQSASGTSQACNPG